jgi:tetratricopeptide (TPR) repeat protein
MPSHIYLRVGRYHDASVVNERAIKADESYIAQCKAQGVYPGAYYPHNIHLLWYAADLEGRGAYAIKAAQKVADYALDLRCGAIEGPRLRYLHLLAFARFGRWDDILNAASPGPEYPFDRAMWHYARGLAFVGRSKPEEAALEFSKLEEFQKSEAVRAMDNPYFPGTKILAVANRVLAGKVAGARGKTDEMIQLLEMAVQAQNDLPYMEPPYWYYSVRQSLGAALLKADKPAEAEHVFREDLNELRDNGWSLFGLAESLRTQGRVAEAKKVEKRLKKAWQRADVQPDLAGF